MRARPRWLGRSHSLSALTQLTQILPWLQDTRTHYGITTVEEPRTWPGGGGSSMGGENRLLQPFAGASTHSQARQTLCGSLAAVKTLVEAPVASREASTTFPGYLTLLNR